MSDLAYFGRAFILAAVVLLVIAWRCNFRPLAYAINYVALVSLTAGVAALFFALVGGASGGPPP